MDMDRDTLSPRVEYAVLGCIILLGLVLRVMWLGTPCYWIDEVLQVRAAMMPTFRESMSQVPLNKPYLFYALQFFVARISVNEWIFRLPSCLAGAASVWVIWGLARSLYQDSRVSLLAAALLATSPLHIECSQDARPYAVALLFALGGIWAMFESLRMPTRFSLVCAALLPALSGWTLYFGVGLLGLEIVWVGGMLLLSRLTGADMFSEEERRSLRATLSALVAAVILLFPLAIRFMTGTADMGDPSSEGADRFTLSLLSRIAEWLTFDYASGMRPATLTMALLALMGMVKGFRTNRANTVFLLLLFFLLQGIQIAVYVHAERWIAPRYHLIYIAPLLIFSSVGFAWVLKVLRLKDRWYVVALGLVSFALAWTAQKPVEMWRRRIKSDVREVVTSLARQAAPGDVVIGSGLKTEIAYQFYRERLPVEAPPICDFTNMPEAIRLLQGATRIWIVYHAVWMNMNLDLLHYLDPGLPDSMPFESVIRAVEPPPSLYDALMSSERLCRSIDKMDLRLPALLKMGDMGVGGVLDRAWGTPKEYRGEVVRWMRGREGAVVFRLKESMPSVVLVRVIRRASDEAMEKDFSLWWNNTLLLRISNLDTAEFTTLSAPVPSSAVSGDFQVLRLVCGPYTANRETARSEEEAKPLIAVADIEIR